MKQFLSEADNLTDEKITAFLHGQGHSMDGDPCKLTQDFKKLVEVTTPARFGVTMLIRC